jgi:hypothetical protein
MEQLRVSQKNKMRNDIKMLEKHIEISTNTIEYRKNTLRADDTFNTDMIEKLELQRDERLIELEQLKKRLDDVVNGLLDSELGAEANRVKDEVERKAGLKRAKKVLVIEDKKERKCKLHEFYNNEKNNNRQQRYTRNDVNRTYKYYHKICDSIPDYLTKKLKNMPNNKGYIWRGVHCYGNKPAEKNKPRFMYEKRNGIQITHEWTHKHYKLWHREGNNRRKLITNTVRKPKFTQNNLMDYVKKT